MSGPTNVTLNPGTGGASIGADQDPTGTTWEVERAAFGPSGQIPTLVTEATPMPIAETGDALTIMSSALQSSSADDLFNQRTLLDVLDPTSETFVQIPVAPMGIEVPGQAPAARSMPVALANEQILDQNLIGQSLAVGSLGMNALTGTFAAVDVSQYRSIGLQINCGSSTGGTLTFEGSNDGQNFFSVNLFDVASTAGGVTTAVLAGGTFRFFAGPLQFRYFRARVSASITGSPLVALTRLSMAPFSNVNISTNLNSVGSNGVAIAAAGVQNVGMAYVGAAAAVAAGVAGTLAVGGNLADGSTPTLYASRIAGIDPQGLLRTMRTDAQGNLAVQQDPATLAAPNTNELLLLVLAQLKVMTFYMRELSVSLNSGIPLTDEEAAILSDPTLFN